MNNISDSDKLENEVNKLISDFQQIYPEIYNQLLMLSIANPSITYKINITEISTNDDSK